MTPDASTGKPLDLVAYNIYDTPPTAIVPAPARRGWMDATPNSYANRCLPLMMANQSGWEIPQTGGFTAVWNSSPLPDDISIVPHGPPPHWTPIAHFGGGTLTWHIPWLFRTPPGWNLLIRGPANRPKDGVAPLEGLLESDWMTQTTTYSVKLTRPGLDVHYDDGEPVCMIVPQRRDDMEQWQPRMAPMPVDVAEHADAFSRSRGEFNAGPRAPKDWQRHYSQGKAPGGVAAPDGEHRNRRRLREFLTGTG